MRNFTFILLFAFIFQATAQNLQRPVPESWNIATIEKVVPIELQKPNLTTLQAEDAVNDLDKSIPWRFGYDHFVDYGLNNAGKWHTLPNGDRIWRVNIISPDALTMNLIFDRYHIPVGGKVYIYNDDRSQILNTFTHLHNNPEEILGTWMVNGESLWIEYFEPKKVSGQARLNIGNVIHGYRTADMYNENNPEALNDSGACNVDVNCDITGTSVLANDIKDDVKKSVGMLVSGGNGFCTGALVNNTNNDGTPYFLTANHCLGGSVAGWAFRFNWASDASVADCATTAPSVDNTFLQTASGAILRAANSESDMALVEITDAAFFAGSPDVVWAGWNRSTTAVPSLNVGVHHPSGDIQKVCVDFEGATRTVSNFNGNPTTEMWRIADWDLGVTEPGSSGSPLFDQNGLIIGKLSGGSAACSGTNDNGGFDIYGRFGVSWDFGTTNATQLQFWLDPAGTNPMDLVQFPPLQTFDYDAAISILNIPTDLCDATITPTLRIRNAGNLQLTSATIMHQLDSNTAVTINWTGSLSTDQFEDIPLSAIAVSGQGAHSFVATVANPNGNVDQSPSNDSNTKNFTIPDSFATTTIRVIITPDRYGGETTWQLANSAGTVVGSGGPYTTTGTNGTQPDEIQDITITAFDDCYTFTINDSYGDGICCLYGAGTYRLEDGASNILVTGNGDFGATASDLFKITDPSLSVSESLLGSNLRIYPNPSAADFTVAVSNFTNVAYEISSITGQRIQAGSFSNGNNTLSMRSEAAGMYFIRITDLDSNISVTKKIVKY
ncbi:T9SS type A sorting domain-containing protein [Kordia sp. YSTF-M3]|uniref:T9SS type A sorting domain-containing protein n=1 Tax=Kordia aestuariivivens TaxID=2759037 RepID=A0ABR7QBM4_9FLAO|nr:T9SS type A sorting domain-containing protein [Kordia aestuariivivens]MBC8755913.1 T9SS type A sorting domain-containing protein [Kordia aestuariivivens]